MQAEDTDGHRIATGNGQHHPRLTAGWSSSGTGRSCRCRDIRDRGYNSTEGRTLVATVPKEMAPRADVYDVEVAPDQERLAVLAATVSIDMTAHGRR